MEIRKNSWVMYSELSIQTIVVRDPFFCIPQRITFTAIVVSITNDVHLTLMEGNLHWFINKLVRAHFQFVLIILFLVPDVRHSTSWRFSFGKSADIDVNKQQTEIEYRIYLVEWLEEKVKIEAVEANTIDIEAGRSNWVEVILVRFFYPKLNVIDDIAVC